MASTVLVGYDDTPASAAALAAAEALAVRLGDEICVVAAYEAMGRLADEEAPRLIVLGRTPELLHHLGRAARVVTCPLLVVPSGWRPLHGWPAAPIATNDRTVDARVARDVTSALGEPVHTAGDPDVLVTTSPTSHGLRHSDVPVLVVPPQVEPPPATADDALWAAAVEDARLAPSTHNTQPWIFRRTARGLDLVADATRSLTVVDPAFRELVISGGAALHHIRVSLAARGHRVRLDVLPDETDEPILARLWLKGPHTPTSTELAMAGAIVTRHTDRGEYADEQLPAEPFDHLRTFAADEGARLTVISDDSRRAALAEIVADGDRAQASRAAVLRELVAWLRIPGRHQHDGLPLAMALEGPRRRAAREERLAAAGPVLAVISTLHDEPRDWLRSGQALSAVLLGATARGLSASFFNAPIEEPAFRAAVADAAEAPGSAQLLLRLGHGDGAGASPRRTVDEILR